VCALVMTAPIVTLTTVCAARGEAVQELCGCCRTTVPSSINESECGCGGVLSCCWFFSIAPQQQLLGMLEGRAGLFQLLLTSA